MLCESVAREKMDQVHNSSLEEERFLKNSQQEEMSLQSMLGVMVQENQRRDAMMERMMEKFMQASLSANTNNLSVMPEVLRNVPDFDGDVHKGREWIASLKSVKTLHELPESYMLETARNKLKRGAFHWYERRRFSLTTWEKFLAEFEETFVMGESVTEIFQRMTNRSQGRNESISDYFHEKVSLCSKLGLTEPEMKQQILLGLWSKDTYAAMIPKLHTNMNKLLHDLLEFEQLNNERLARTKGKREEPISTNRESARPVSPRQNKKNLQVTCYKCGRVGHYARDCVQQDIKCFACRELGHVSKDCPKRTTRQQTRDNTTMIIDQKTVPAYVVPCKIQTANEPIEVNAVLDTGASASFLSEDLIDGRHINKADSWKTFYGVNGTVMNVLGTYCTTIHVIECNAEISIKFYIVPKAVIPCVCILGRDFVAQPDLEITFGAQLQIVHKNIREYPEFLSNEVLMINEQPQDPLPNLDIESSLEPKVQKRVVELFQKNYVEPVRPEKPNIDFEMNIKLVKDHMPFFCRPRRLSYYENSELSKMLKELLDKGIIKRSTSEYSSRVVLVSKKDGTLRMCVDFRSLNKLVIRDNFPMPVMEEQIEMLQGKVFFTQLDLKNAFYHVQVKEECTKYLSFVTPNGQFEFLRMPFGFCNAPSTFMRYINAIFRGLIETGKIIIYMDDLLIATETVEENLSILKEILKIVVDNKLELRIDKCTFLKRKITYLGYEVSAQGIKPSASNVDSVIKYPIPQNQKELHSFIGLASYFRKFIHEFSLIAKPLYNLLRRETAFEFGPDELNVFNELKSRLAEQPILSLYSPSVETELHCDACQSGYGAILLQRQKDGNMHPVFYFSKRTTDAESRYHSYELECLAIVYSIKRFHIYLQNLKFKIVTDCNSLRLTLEKRDIVPRIMRWAMFLENYNYDVEHRGNDRMRHVDALSRANHILILEDNTFEQNLAISQNLDRNIQRIKADLTKEQSTFFELRNGLVYRKSNSKLLFYVPESMHSSVLRASHDQMGHVGIDKTSDYILQTYWFPKLREKVKNYINNCLRCITYNGSSGKPEGSLHNIPKGNKPFVTIHIDHYGPLEKTSTNKRYIFEVIDAFTKFVKFYSVKSTGVKEVIGKLTDYFSNYSKPLRIISDRGAAFTSNEFQNFVEEQGITHIKIATGVPRANGQIERINRDLTPMLGKLTEIKDRWDETLPMVEFAINNTISRSVQTAPAVLLFGVVQRDPYDNVRNYIQDNNSSDEPNEHIETIRVQAEEANTKLQDYNKNLYDKKHKQPTEYEVGDYVVLTNIDNTPGVNKKLMPRYKGPYEVERKLGNDRYLIRDVEGFQFSQKPFHAVYSSDRMRKWLEVSGEVE